MGMQQATTNCTSRSFFIGFLDIYLALISAIESTRGYFKFRGKSQFTIAERDNALQKFKTEFQNYVDNLSEADMISSNIKTILSEKAVELENSLSTAQMKLSCEVESVEVHDAGTEIVNN